MSAITVDVPDELAQRLRVYEDELPRIIEAGLRCITAEEGEYGGGAEFIQFLAGLPRPEEILALQPSPGLQSRFRELSLKRHGAGLTAVEEQELQHYLFLEHIVRMAKGRAQVKLAGL